MTRDPGMLFDVGAQFERTTLAWTRTALALAAVGGLIARLAIRTAGASLGYAIAAVALAPGVTAALSAIGSYDRRHARLQDGEPVVSPRPLICVAVTLALASGVSLGMVLT